MSFEPKSFFVGVIDFFSILLPGALFLYVLTVDFEANSSDKKIGALLRGTEAVGSAPKGTEPYIPPYPPFASAKIGLGPGNCV